MLQPSSPSAQERAALAHCVEILLAAAARRRARLAVQAGAVASSAADPPVDIDEAPIDPEPGAPIDDIGHTNGGCNAIIDLGRN